MTVAGFELGQAFAWPADYNMRYCKPAINLIRPKSCGEREKHMRMISIRSLAVTLVVLAASAASFGQFRVAITFGPPALPVYEQPLCPGDGYMWTPGYWYWDDDAEDYYWVPGTWVLAPEPGFLWTPGYWGWGGGAFLFHEGYWGPHVGFYGGISYGFGYWGGGYDGGRWDGGHFFYNRTVNNVNITNIHNVYNTTVVHETVVNRVSYNGGNGGIEARATAEQETAARERHIAPVSTQTQHMQTARSNPELRASVNKGRPPIAATARPGEFKSGATPAREAGAPYHPPANRPARGNEAPRPENNASRPENNASRPEGNPSRPNNPVHVKDLPAREKPTAPNTGNARLDQKYQQQQEKLAARQDQERQKLQQKQEQDHQRATQQKNAEARTQQLEQKHQQQTQQLQQRHEAQQQHLQQRQQPPARPKGK